MEVNRLLLPEALVEEIYRHGRTQWMLRRYLDAYGNYFGVGHFELLIYEEMVEETERLPDRFESVPEEYASMDADRPGFIPPINDYSRIVVFGQPATGAPFCLDYRDNLKEPSVIYLDAYTYWRRVARTFGSFLELIEPFEPVEYKRRLEEEEARILREQADAHG